MKKILLMAALLLTATAAQAQGVFDQVLANQARIAVDGYSRRTVAPDRIFVRMLISEQQLKSKTTVEQIEHEMIAILKKLDIDVDKKLKLDRMSSLYRDRFLKSGQSRTSAMYELEVGSAEELGKVYQRLEVLGGVNMSVVRTDHSQREQIMNELRTEALRNARKIAEQLAAVEEMEVGKPIYIGDRNRTVYTGSAMGARVFVTGEEYVTPLEFKDMELSYDLNVTFELLKE